jgi:hypothetical protein
MGQPDLSRGLAGFVFQIRRGVEWSGESAGLVAWIDLGHVGDAETTSAQSKQAGQIIGKTSLDSPCELVYGFALARHLGR